MIGISSSDRTIREEFSQRTLVQKDLLPTVIDRILGIHVIRVVELIE